MQFEYRAKLTTDPEGGYLATFPDVPEAITSGATKALALESAADALAVALLGRMEDGDDLPAASASGRGLHPVAVPAPVAAKLAVMAAFKASGWAKIKLAEELGVNEKEVRRILDASHNTQLGRLNAAMQALGGRLIVSAEWKLAG
ncbi:MAG: HicB family protein [Hyphomicrobiales bacterium]|nr:MAG: HicB family protein [Hyphomicrobiales bacterium]